MNNIYIYKDKTTGQLGLPFFFINDATAIKNVIRIAKQEENEHGTKFTEKSCELIRIGTYNEEDGTITVNDSIVIDWTKKLPNLDDFLEGKLNE